MNLSPTLLEFGKFKIKMMANSVSGESSLPGLQIAAFLLYSHMAERDTQKKRNGKTQTFIP